MVPHEERQHALLSASSAHRWLHCNTSARLEEKFPEETSIYAEEGTLAHEIAELKLRKKFFPDTDATALATRMDELEQHSLYKSEMQKFTDTYIEYLNECALSFSDTPIIIAEHKVDFSRWVPEGFGTCDCAMIGDDTLHVIDFKYGKGVQVDAKRNEQLRLYAAGVLDAYGLIYPIRTVKMSIVQPRLGHISQDTLSAQMLLEWMEEIVEPMADLAYHGSGHSHVGDWCRFCRARSQCPFLAGVHLDKLHELTKLPGYTDSGSRIVKLSPQQVGDILDYTTLFSQWLKAVEKGALDMLLHGESVPGWKVVEGRSCRAFSDADAAFQALKKAGIAEELLYKPREHITLAAAEKLVGKEEFAKLCGQFIYKPQGAPTLAPENDIRPAMEVHPVTEDFSKLSPD